jgi:hypothetical protein
VTGPGRYRMSLSGMGRVDAVFANNATDQEQK